MSPRLTAYSAIMAIGICVLLYYSKMQPVNELPFVKGLQQMTITSILLIMTVSIAVLLILMIRILVGSR
jgi:hypothetical protein